MRRILHVVGARPNFMKMAPFASTPLSTGLHEMARYPDEFEQILVHTGQHDDANMSQMFCDEMELPRPDVNLEVGSGSPAQQTALIHRGKNSEGCGEDEYGDTFQGLVAPGPARSGTRPA